MQISIRRVNQKEYFMIETVVRTAFWNVYKPGCDEHLMVNQLHQSSEYIPELDFVAECDGKIIGNILCSKGRLVDDITHSENHEAIIIIGPIGILPEYQNSGVGGLLINTVKEQCLQMGIAGIVLYGNPQYYHRFGFVNAKNYNISTPKGENFEEFMALEVSPGSLQNMRGKCHESKAFEVDKDTLMEFEKNFAPPAPARC